MNPRYTFRPLPTLARSSIYIAAHSPQSARPVQARIQALTNLLLLHPHIGRHTNDPAIRRMTTPPYPYFVFYEVTDTEIVIHAIRHAPLAPCPWGRLVRQLQFPC